MPPGAETMPHTACTGSSGGDKKETVAVLGLGRLGLCFAVVLEQAGYKVVSLHSLPVSRERSPSPRGRLVILEGVEGAL